MGLISVDQLSLCVEFSGFQGMTEVYNLVKAGNANDHNVIPGTEKAALSNPWTGPLFSQQTLYVWSKSAYSGPLNI